jgi:lycopene cyclase CruA
MSTLAESRSRLRDAAGAEFVERIDHLDAQWRERGARVPAPCSLLAPDASTVVDYDVAIVGGGLWSIFAPLLRARGLRVAVFDRSRAAASHREWNASAPELQALVRAGLVSSAELEELIVARYDHGVCRFHGGSSYDVTGVLDCAVDAGALLAGARELASSRGVAFHDDHALVAQAAGPAGVRMRFREMGGGERELTARVMVDARGASSPFATADLVCPTVGGVVRGLVEGGGPDEVDPNVGEILATVDSVEDGRQHVWESFPGRMGETTVYVFYYARSGEPVSLWELYGRFFSTLPTYKRGNADLVRPTFGYIPGWSRLSAPPSAPHPRIVLVGDAASRHSSLTYCGFGATLRSLDRAAERVHRLVNDERLDDPRVVDDRPVHALTGVLAYVMASRRFQGNDLNTLLDAAFRTLRDMGNESYAALLRDEMDTGLFLSFLRQTARRHPAVWGKALRGLSPATVGRWGLSVAGTALGWASP